MCPKPFDKFHQRFGAYVPIFKMKKISNKIMGYAPIFKMPSKLENF
jgi:hypothetical protein